MGPWLIGRAAGPYGSPNFFNRRPHARPVLVDGVSERITAFRTLSSIGAARTPIARELSCGFDANPVIDGCADALFVAEISLGCLD
jgi:hypothetical protein